MDPNPYQSPREVGYDYRAPSTPMPLWRRIIRVILSGLAVVFVGWFTIAIVGMAVDLCRWYFGF